MHWKHPNLPAGMTFTPHTPLRKVNIHADHVPFDSSRSVAHAACFVHPDPTDPKAPPFRNNGAWKSLPMTYGPRTPRWDGEVFPERVAEKQTVSSGKRCQSHRQARKGRRPKNPSTPTFRACCWFWSIFNPASKRCMVLPKVCK